jgi:quinol-cytochrome oxidoreductase complex cytochrome b subunit
MSLRTFHIVFVVVTVALSIFVTAWGYREYTLQQSNGGLALAIIFFVTAVVMTIYGKKVYTKLKELP